MPRFARLFCQCRPIKFVFSVMVGLIDKLFFLNYKYTESDNVECCRHIYSIYY